MYSLQSSLIYVVNSIFSVIYSNLFLQNKYHKKFSLIFWINIYFFIQFIMFELIYKYYPFNSVLSTIINILLILGMQLLFFHKKVSEQLFVCFSFISGKEIVKYIVSVFSLVIGNIFSNLIDLLAMQGMITTYKQVTILNNVNVCIMSISATILYGLIFGFYLFLINKSYVRKQYQLKLQEIIFLILPSIVSICISITIRMMIVTVESGTTALIYDSVPATLFWIPLICFMLLGSIIANVILFQNVVEYHEENKKRMLLENQIEHMQREVQEIQDIYADMRGLRHDLKGHINNIIHFVNKYNNYDIKELYEYINSMNKTVEKLDYTYHTGNPITDVIIHQKIQETNRLGIKFTVDFEYPKGLLIDVYDVAVILNNALENALEAASMLERNKYISLYSYMKGNLFFIEIENSFINNIIINKETCLLESSKENKKYHGLGLSNIQKCARKYKGDIDIIIDSSKKEYSTFNLTVMINVKTTN